MRALQEEEEEEEEDEEEGEGEFFVPSGTTSGQLSAFTEYTVKKDKNIVQCTVCGQKFKGSLSKALRHVEAIHFPWSYSYKCSMCDKEFGNYNSFHSHCRRKH